MEIKWRIKLEFSARVFILFHIIILCAFLFSYKYFLTIDEDKQVQFGRNNREDLGTQVSGLTTPPSADCCDKRNDDMFNSKPPQGYILEQKKVEANKMYRKMSRTSISQYKTYSGSQDDIVYDENKVLRAAKEIHDKHYSHVPGEECRKRLPTCIIIGVFKCGTRELIDFMAMHPNIVIKGYPELYELPFFLQRNYTVETSTKSYENLRNQMPCSHEDQITVFKHPGYFENSLVPQRLYNYNKNLKMILLVRQPVKRLISHIWYQNSKRNVALNESGVWSYVRQRYLNEREGKVKDNVMVRYSIYDQPMKRYLKFFNLSQFLIIEATELQKDPVKVLAQVERFLGLPKFISHEHFFYDKAKHFFCINVPEKPVCYGVRRGRNYTNGLSSKTYNILYNFYKPHSEKFFELINKTFDW